MNCDLKIYQDLLTFSYIDQNIIKGSKILEIGGGDSRILEYFKESFECWNLDKMEGIGNGPIGFDQKSYKLIPDYIGNFNSGIPENYFDFVFSISALEHIPIDNPVLFENVLSDINRILKPGGYSMHCIDHSTDLLLGTIEEAWTNPLIIYFYENERIINDFIPLISAEEDPDLFCVSENFYKKYWEPVTGISYNEFGKPFSFNLLWKKNS